MSIYAVYEPPLKGREAAPDPARFAFVRDGFSFWAFLLAPLWMLRYRLWLAFVGYVIIAVVLSVGLRGIGASGASTAVALLLSLLVGFEASTLRRFGLSRRGWSRNTLKPGDSVTVTFRPMKDGEKGGMFVNAKRPSGEVLTMTGGAITEP